MKGPLYSRADILSPTGEDDWNIVEVKSATSIKAVNCHDVAFQKFCWEEAGATINKCFLMYINRDYVKNGEIDPHGLFIVQDISEEVNEAGEGIRKRIEEMLDIINCSNCPSVDIGPHCDDPFTCGLKEECWSGLPEHNVFTLCHGGKKNYELYQKGIVDIVQIPLDYKFSDKQLIQYRCVTNGSPYINRTEIKRFLQNLEYPLYYFDFETFDTAVPLFDGTRPYQKIPFQFSLHIQRLPGTEPEHYSFLAEGRDDPRPALLEALNKVMGTKGSILVYNKSFEESILNGLGEAFKEHSGLVKNMASRLVDLIIPFRNFHYYHPSQKGSASLKSVLPVLTGLSYDDMPIGEGGEASAAYLAITFGEVSKDEAAVTRQQLLNYCKLDTEGMVRIVETLNKLID